MRTIAGRLVRELQRLLPTNNEYLEFFGLADKILSQKKGTKKKVYSLSDYRLGRNFYKGLQGDAINVILAAAAYNFKRAMKVLLLLLKSILGTAEMCFEIRFPENKLAF